MSSTRSAVRGARRPTRSQARRRRWGWLLVAAALCVGLAVGFSRLDFDKLKRELTLPLQHDDIIRQQADEKNLDPAMIAAVIYAESRFRDDQISEAGARGLMQITPDTARVIERLSGGTTFVTADLSDPEINIRYGSYYLRYLLDRYDDNEVAALAAYHAGSGNVDRWGGADLTESDIGFPDTRAYVGEVLQKQEDYRDHYAEDLGLSH
jgi:soluble lytic murein transglycosylase